jgi:hypothetical protein
MKIAISELEHLREEIKNCHQIIKDFQMKREWVGLTDEEVAIASAEFDTKLKLAFHAGMYKAQIILRKKNDPTY